jgi:hypothetical protein
MMRATLIRLVVIVPAAVIGAVMLLASLGVFGRPVSHPGDAPDWIGALIGFIFLGGAGAAFISVVSGAADQSNGEFPSGTSALVRTMSGVLGVAVTIVLGIAFVWVGFGPGERHFTGSGAFMGPFVGRAMFGLFGMLTFLFVGWTGFRWLKRRPSERETAD